VYRRKQRKDSHVVDRRQENGAKVGKACICPSIPYTGIRLK